MYKFVFPSVYSVLIYHGYTNDNNIGSFGVGTWQSIFPTTKQPSIIICYFNNINKRNLWTFYLVL